MSEFEVITGDCIDVMRGMDAGSADCCVTSPPYWGLRDYGTAKWEGGAPNCDHRQEAIRIRRNLAEAANACDGGNRKAEDRMDNEALGLPFRDVCGKCGARRVDQQLGLEETPERYTERMVEVFREVWRVLADHGSLWLNIGDSYARDPGKGGSGPNGKHDYQDEYGAARKHMAKFRPGSGRADGVVDDRCQRNCDGVPPVPGLKGKDLVGIPWRLAFALQADGWYLRSDIIWSKPNPMPESVTDRPTKAHEYIFLLTKQARYYYDAVAVLEASSGLSGGGFSSAGMDVGRIRRDAARERPADTGTRNRRTVWTVTTEPFPEAHFATYPTALVEPCIRAGCPEQVCVECGKPWERVVEKVGGTIGESWHDHSADLSSGMTQVKHGGGVGNAKSADGVPYTVRDCGFSPTCACNAATRPGTVLDPFTGSGTTGLVAMREGRNFVGCELNPEYAEMARRRIAGWRHKPIRQRGQDAPEGQETLFEDVPTASQQPRA